MALPRRFLSNSPGRTSFLAGVLLEVISVVFSTPISIPSSTSVGDLAIPYDQMTGILLPHFEVYPALDLLLPQNHLPSEDLVVSCEIGRLAFSLGGVKPFRVSYYSSIDWTSGKEDIPSITGKLSVAISYRRIQFLIWKESIATDTSPEYPNIIFRHYRIMANEQYRPMI